MEKTLQLIKNFEKRNNISITVTLCSDGSSSTNEFWDDEKLKSSDTVEELHKFLQDTQYELDEKGICKSPEQTM